MEAFLLGLSQYGYIGLFFASFLASTVLPFSSEAVFTALLYAADCNVWLCIASATIGNTLGSFTCYGLGRLGKIEWIEKYLHVSEEKVNQWTGRIQKWAIWSTFFCFLPGIGDLIAIAAGFLRTHPIWTLLLIALGKFLRYIFWVYITYWAFL